MKTETAVIWMPLLNEGTKVSRPTRAEKLGANTYRILATPDYDPDDEEWAYVPGSLVRCTLMNSDDGTMYLLATERTTLK